MAKKNFKESNPALQFISSTNLALREIPEPEETLPVSEKVAEKPAPDAPFTHAPATPRRVRTSGETKSKRLNLLLQPSVLDDLAKIACMRQTSVNDLINQVLREHAAEQTALVRRYDDVFGR